MISLFFVGYTMLESVLEVKIYKRVSEYLVAQFKSKNPDFERKELRTKILEIQAWAKNDDLLLFINQQLSKKSNFEDSYLIGLIDSLLTDDVLANLYPSIEFFPLKNERKIDELYALIGEFIEKSTQELDRRQQDDTDRYLRRLDSLARVLSLSISNSACVAVSIHQGRLIVASNVGGRSTPEQIISALTGKIATLKEIVALCPFTDFLQIYAFCTDNRILSQFIGELGCGVGPSSLQRSLAKVLHVLKSNEYPFSQIFRDVLADNQLISVLTPESVQGEVVVRVTSHLPVVDIVNHIPFPQTIDKTIRLRDVHAEQMIHKFIGLSQPAATNEGPIRVGISKLCCLTCYKVFSNSPEFRVRGTHNNSYKGTLDVLTGMRTVENSDYYGVCNPIDSGLFSPCNNTLSNLGVCAAETEEPVESNLTEGVDETGLGVVGSDLIFLIEDYSPVNTPVQRDNPRNRVEDSIFKFFNKEKVELSKDQLSPEDPMELSDFVMFDSM